jgi:hypothetical protein
MPGRSAATTGITLFQRHPPPEEAGLISMYSTSLPIIQQFMVVLFGLPVMAILWWGASRGLGRAVQGGSVSGRTKLRQRKEFWMLLVVMYVLGFGVMLFSRFKGS